MGASFVRLGGFVLAIGLLSCSDVERKLDGHIACAGGTCACQESWGDCDGDPDNGCETTLNSPDHCGACNHSCLDGACVNRQCQIALISSWGTRECKAGNGKTVFFGRDDPGATDGKYSIMRVEDGDSVASIWGGSPVDLPYLAGADDANIYVQTSNYDNVLGWYSTGFWAIPIDAPDKPRKLGDEAGGCVAASGGGFVYWIDGDHNVVRTPIAGGATEVIPDVGWVQSADERGAYHVSGFEPVFVRHDGPPEATPLPGWSSGLALVVVPDGEDVYVATDKGVYRGRPWGNAEYTLLEGSQDIETPWSAVVSGDYLYLATDDPEVLQQQQNYETRGQIVRIPIAGGQLQRVAHNVTLDYGFEVTENAVYYHDFVAFSLVRIAKPLPSSVTLPR
jgi:hypothetical protein